jgi:hypothetical protein
LLALLAALLAVPEVRAGIVEFLQIGDVRIFFGGRPTPSAAPSPASAATATPRGAAAAGPTATPHPFLRLAGEMTLAEAEEEAGFDLLWPAYPSGLGEPDHVYLQDMNGVAVIMVWLNPAAPDRPGLVLYTLDLGPDAFAGKFEWDYLEGTTVGGRAAFWVQGEHYLFFHDGSGELNMASARLVSGNVLVWQQGDLTYRLETDASLEEAVRIAESLE